MKTTKLPSLLPLPLLLLLFSSPPLCDAALRTDVFKSNITVDGLSTFVISVSQSFLTVVASNDQTSGFNLTAMLNLLFDGGGGGGGDLIGFLTSNVTNVLLFKVGLLVLVIIGVLFIVFMPIVGFCMCCCRCCCGKCGGGERKARNKSCKRGCCGLFLFATLVLMLICIAGSFLVAWNLNTKGKELISTNPMEGNVLVKGLADVSPIVEDILDDVKTAGLKTLDDVVDSVTRDFVKVGADVKAGIATRVGAFGPLLDSIVDVILPKYVGGLDDVESLVEAVGEINGTELMAAVEKLRSAIDDCVTQNDAACENLNKTALIGPIDVGTWLDGLPSTADSVVAREALNVTASTDVRALVDESRSRIDGVGGIVESTVKDLNSTVTNMTVEAKARVEELLDDGLGGITTKADSLVDMAVNATKGFLTSANDAGAADFLDYAFYGMLGLAGLVAGTQLIAVLAYFCACCCRRCSARTLLAFVGLFFLGCALFMLLVLILYNVFGQIYYEGCRPFKSPSADGNVFVDAGFQLILGILSPNAASTTVKGSALMYDCSRGEPIFKIVEDSGLLASFIDDLTSQLNASKLLSNLDGTIDGVRSDVRSVVDGQLDDFDLGAVTSPLTDLVAAAGMTALSASLTLDAAAAKTALTAYNFTEAAAKIKAAAATAGNVAGQKDALDEVAAAFETFGSTDVAGNVVAPALDKIRTAATELGRVDWGVHDNLTLSTSASINSTFDALSPSILSFVNATIDDFRVSLVTRVDGAVSGVLAELRASDVAPCTGVWNLVESFVDVPCGVVVDPLHAYFFGFGAHCMLGILAVIFAVKFAGLLREEANFLAAKDGGGGEKNVVVVGEGKKNRISPAPDDQIYTMQQRQQTQQMQQTQQFYPQLYDGNNYPYE